MFSPSSPPQIRDSVMMMEKNRNMLNQSNKFPSLSPIKQYNPLNESMQGKGSPMIGAY